MPTSFDKPGASCVASVAKIYRDGGDGKAAKTCECVADVLRHGAVREKCRVLGTGANLKYQNTATRSVYRGTVECSIETG